ncbi:hypothetical protein HGB13_03775 [bacterium]|nr:hypothetical protein [bacterium]
MNKRHTLKLETMQKIINLFLSKRIKTSNGYTFTDDKASDLSCALGINKKVIFNIINNKIKDYRYLRFKIERKLLDMYFSTTFVEDHSKNA